MMLCLEGLCGGFSPVEYSNPKTKNGKKDSTTRRLQHKVVYINKDKEEEVKITDSVHRMDKQKSIVPVKKRVGVVGYGQLGKVIVEGVMGDAAMELAFVWNRTGAAFSSAPPEVKQKILRNLGDFATTTPDLVVEVAHPIISKKMGARFLEFSDYFVGSPTALADRATLDALRSAASARNNRVFLPCGALWGADDITKMADAGVLESLEITMKKHPSCWKLEGDLKAKNEKAAEEGKSSVLFEGPVRHLCPLAPHNVNTMAAACVAAHNLGFDKVVGKIVSDPKLEEFHEVEVSAGATASETGAAFNVTSTRRNPASQGAVTGSATFASFLASLRRAVSSKAAPGMHIC